MFKIFCSFFCGTLHYVIPTKTSDLRFEKFIRYASLPSLDVTAQSVFGEISFFVLPLICKPFWQIHVNPQSFLTLF